MIVEAARSGPDGARCAALHYLAEASDPAVLDLIEAAAVSPSRTVADAAVAAFERMCGDAAVDRARRWAHRPDALGAVRRPACSPAGAAPRTPHWSSALCATPYGATGPTHQRLWTLVDGAGRLGIACAAPVLRHVYRETSSSHLRGRAARALAATDPSFATGFAVECLWDCEETTREVAALARGDRRHHGSPNGCADWPPTRPRRPRYRPRYAAGSARTRPLSDPRHARRARTLRGRAAHLATRTSNAHWDVPRAERSTLAQPRPARRQHGYACRHRHRILPARCQRRGPLRPADRPAPRRARPRTARHRPGQPPPGARRAPTPTRPAPWCASPPCPCPATPQVRVALPSRRRGRRDHRAPGRPRPSGQPVRPRRTRHGGRRPARAARRRRLPDRPRRLRPYVPGRRRGHRLAPDPRRAQRRRPHPRPVHRRPARPRPSTACRGCGCGRAASTPYGSGPNCATRHCAARSRPDGELIVGYVGRLAPEKHVELLAGACGLPGVRVVVVGDGPSEPSLRAALPGAVFLGRRTGDELARIFASLDVFAHTGPYETFCQTVQEAMASGVPVDRPGGGRTARPRRPRADRAAGPAARRRRRTRRRRRHSPPTPRCAAAYGRGRRGPRSRAGPGQPSATSCSTTTPRCSRGRTAVAA